MLLAKWDYCTPGYYNCGVIMAKRINLQMSLVFTDFTRALRFFRETKVVQIVYLSYALLIPMILILRARSSDKKLDERDKNSRDLLRVINENAWQSCFEIRLRKAQSK